MLDPSAEGLTGGARLVPPPTAAIGRKRWRTADRRDKVEPSRAIWGPRPIASAVMIWFYERGTETLRIETRFNNEARVYELIWYHPDGTRTVESFADEAQFRARSAAVESGLLDEDWRSSGSPQLLREGWKLG